MDKLQERPVQRTLIVTCGGMADEVGAHLKSRLAASTEPREAVAVVSGQPEASDEAGATLSTALQQISRVAARESLSSRGWALDRLDEIKVFVVLDLGGEISSEDVIDLTQQIVGTARKQLSVDALVTLMVLAPDLEDDAATELLSSLHRACDRFIHGLILLSKVNERGLCLDGEKELSASAGRLLHAMIATPLRDAPAWLVEQSSFHAQAFVQSMGITVWEWSPAAVRFLLARHAVKKVLEQWLGDAPEGVRARSAEGWLAAQNLEREKLARALGPAPPDGTVLAPVAYPQPWRLRKTYSDLCVLDVTFRERIVEGFDSDVAQAATQAREALQERARQMLDETPAGGIVRLQHFIHSLCRSLDELQDRLAADDTVQEERAAALAGLHERLAATMQTHLDRWPLPRPKSWLRVTVSPWCWPRLAWRYWQMAQLARQLQQVAAEWRRWQWQRARNRVIHRLYSQLADEGERVRNQAEELADMLQHVRRTLDEENTFVPAVLSKRPDYLDRRYKQVTETLPLEAGWAAPAIGGLGRQLTEPDDAFLEPLLSMIEERIVAAGDCTAAGALALLYPSEAELSNWWQQRWEAAAPLWRYDSTDQDEFKRTQPSHLTLVCGDAAPALRQMLDLPEANDTRWLATPDPDLIIMRVRGAIPVAEARNDAAERRLDA